MLRFFIFSRKTFFLNLICISGSDRLRFFVGSKIVKDGKQYDK